MEERFDDKYFDFYGIQNDDNDSFLDFPEYEDYREELAKEVVLEKERRKPLTDIFKGE